MPLPNSQYTEYSNGLFTISLLDTKNNTKADAIVAPTQGLGHRAWLQGDHMLEE